MENLAPVIPWNCQITFEERFENNHVNRVAFVDPSSVYDTTVNHQILLHKHYETLKDHHLLVEINEILLQNK